MAMRAVIAAMVLMVLALAVPGCAGGGGKASRNHSRAWSASSASGDQAFLEQYAATNRFRLGTPTAITCVPGGKHVLFLRSGPRSFVQDLYEFDIETGRERVLLTSEQILAGGEEQLTAEELARRERMRLASRGIASYSLSKDGTRILVPLSGRLFVIDRAGGSRVELASSAGFPIDPRFSPDGSKVSCVRDGEVYVIDVASGSETRITSGAGGTITNGLAEFVAQEEMDRREGYWWSPDSVWIAYQQTDTNGMEVFRIADPVNPEKEATEWPYPRAGKENARVKLGVIGAAGGDTMWVNWDSTRWPYLARVDWPENGPMTILVQNREQTEQALLRVEPASGDTLPLLVERDEAWLNLHGVPKWIEGGRAFLWITDAGGDERLERHEPATNGRTTIVQGMTNLGGLSVDEARGHVYFVAGETPIKTDVWRLSMSSRASAERLSPAEGTHSAVIAKDFASGVMLSTAEDGLTSWSVRRSDWTEAGRLSSKAERSPLRERHEHAIVKGASGRSYHTSIFRPADWREGTKYPVILSVYGGPGLQYATLAPRGAVLDQWFADHGFIVARIDGRGTPGRGREWERAIKGDLGTIPLDDQVEALQALGARNVDMDLKRVGVYGWSFGGYFSAMAAMRRPDVFACGVAGAPVADWRDYDTHYTERFMGLPDANSAGYDRASVLTYCKDLQVPLLIIHGTADDNVYFMHSLKMCDALFRSGKHFEFLALPGFTHMVPDPVVTKALYGRIAEFFVTHLGVE